MALGRLERWLFRYGLILFVVIGYLIQNVLIYWAFSQVPQRLLSHSYLVITLQGNIYLLPTYALLLIGVILFQSERPALIRRYAMAVIVPALIFTGLAHDAGHAFMGLIALAFLIQWIVLLIGTVHFGILFRQRNSGTAP